MTDHDEFMMIHSMDVNVRLVGLVHYKESSLLCVGESVKLVKDRKNTHDPNAIVVFNHQDKQVGFIKKLQAAVLREYDISEGKIVMDESKILIRITLHHTNKQNLMKLVKVVEHLEYIF